MNLFSRSCAVLLFAAGATFAAPPTDSLRDTELNQRQIRANAQKVADAIGQLLADFDRNGLSVGEDVKVLQAIRSVLGTLTDKEMEQVITLLQAARAAADPVTVQKNTLAAFNSQKQVLARLRQLLIQHQRQQALHELARLLRELASRQDASLRETMTLAQATQGKTAATFDEAQRTALDVQRSEQKAIQAETVHILAALDKFTTATSDERPKLAAAHAKTASLDFLLTAAVADLDEGRLLGASGNQKNIRDNLRAMAKLLATAHDDASRLRQSARDLDIAIQKERELLDATKATASPDNALADKQAENVDRVDQIHKDVQNLSPAADAHLQNAITPMQDARADLLAKQQPRAVANEQAALDSLEKARRELDQQLAKAQRDTQKNADPRAALKDAQKKLADLGQQQEQLQKDSAAKPDKQQADKQTALQKQAQQLQQQTAPQSPKAADALAQASQQMQKAADALQKQQPPMDAQQAAAAALKQAAEAVKDDLAKLDKAADELKSVESVVATLAALIQRQQKLELATGKLLVKPDIKPTATEMAPNQQQLGSDTESLRKNLPADARAADTPLVTARQNMTAASGWLQAAKADAAHPQQEQALANLYKAKNALEKKRDELADELGQPPSNTPEIDKAMKDLAKAQEDTADAQQLLDKAGAAQLQQIQDRQQQLADALRQNPASQDPVAPAAAAQRAAQQAAQQLAKGDLKNALEAMQQAQQAMQQAAQAAPPEQNRNTNQTAQAAQPGEKPPPEQSRNTEPATQPGQPGQPAQPEPGAQPGQASQPEQGAQPGQSQPSQQSGQPGQPSQPGQPGQSGMQAMAQQQQRLQEAAQQLAQTQQNANGQAAMQEAAQALQDAANSVGALATNPGTLPGSVAEPLQNAQMALANATAQANGSTPSNAGAAAASATAAQNAMAAAQAALAAAAAGESGMGEGQGEGQGQGQAGQSTGDGEGNLNGKATSGGLAAVKGAGGQFIGLPPRDRAAIKQSQSEKYPQEFGPLIEQYMKNLADQTSGGK